MKQPIFRVEKFTPDSARKILDANNTFNRPVNGTRVTVYAAEMSAGKWMMTGESIKFADTGKLLDGQHRLLAIIKCGKSIELPVVRGLDPETFKAIDTGKERSKIDVLALNGCDPETSRLVATAAHLAITYAADGTPKSSFGHNQIAAKQLQLTNEGVVAFVDKNPAIVEAARFLMDNRKKGMLVSAGILTWVLYECRKVDVTEAELFILDIICGSMLQAQDPVAVLRDGLISAQKSVRQWPRITVMAGIVTAWNRRRQGKKSIRSVFRNDTETFPKFK